MYDVHNVLQVKIYSKCLPVQVNNRIKPGSGVFFYESNQMETFSEENCIKSITHAKFMGKGSERRKSLHRKSKKEHQKSKS